jgi:hypothetical protein
MEQALGVLMGVTVNYATLKALRVPLHRTSIENSLTGVNSGSSYRTDWLSYLNFADT